MNLGENLCDFILAQSWHTFKAEIQFKKLTSMSIWRQIGNQTFSPVADQIHGVRVTILMVDNV